MKTIGILGGMSWESTQLYYRIINTGINRKLGGTHSAKIILHSFNFAELEQLQNHNNWREIASLLSNAAQKLEACGADCIVIATNTMHRVASDIAKAITIPILHIADATAQAIVAQGIQKVGLLGTKFTMEQDFYRSILTDKYQLEVVIPEKKQRAVVHDIIYNELCRGIIDQKSKQKYIAVVEGLSDRGAEAVILGCTEIGLLLQQQNTKLPLFDTTTLHADTVVNYALAATESAPLFQINCIDHVHIFVKNRQKAVQWYKEVLGLKTIAAYRQWSSDGGPLTIGSGSAHIALFEGDKINSKNTVALQIIVPQFQSFRQHLDQLKIDYQFEDHDLSISVYLADPDGNRYEITAYR